MSHMKITKNESGDGFGVEPLPYHFSKILLGGKEAQTCAKNLWRAGAKPIGKLKDSKILAGIIRYKFELVQNISKAGKPYVVLKVPVSLEYGKPVKVA